MKQSALYRDKYEREDYLCVRTIPRALKQDGEFYDPKYREKRQEEAALSAPAIHPSTVADMEAIAAANPDKDVAIALMMQLGTQDSVAQGFADLTAIVEIRPLPQKVVHLGRS